MANSRIGASRASIGSSLVNKYDSLNQKKDSKFIKKGGHELQRPSSSQTKVTGKKPRTPSAA